MVIRDDYVKRLTTDGVLCARHRAENFAGTLPLNPHHNPRGGCSYSPFYRERDETKVSTTLKAAQVETDRNSTSVQVCLIP